MRQLVARPGAGIVAPDTALVTADDYGITRGDGVFDATRVITGADGTSRIDNLDRHLARFERSARLLDLPPIDKAAWQHLIGEAVDAWDTPGEAALKVVWSRGLEHGTPGGTGFLTLTESVPHNRRPIRVRTMSRGYPSDAFADAPWLLGGAKTLSYAVHTAAKRAAERAGDEDALFVSADGFALEGPTSSLLWLDGDDLVTTPTGATGILESVTVLVIDEALTAEGRPVRRSLARPAEVSGRPAWLVSSVRGVAPVATLDGEPLPADAEWTVKLGDITGF